MLWLRLLRYALTGQRVWVNTGGDGAWLAQVLEAWPDHVVVAVAAGRNSPTNTRMILPLRALEYVREDWEEGFRAVLEGLYASEPPPPDGPEPKDPARVE